MKTKITFKYNEFGFNKLASIVGEYKISQLADILDTIDLYFDCDILGPGRVDNISIEYGGEVTLGGLTTGSKEILKLSCCHQGNIKQTIDYDRILGVSNPFE
ncbi:MAG: hypothetical protein OXB92_17390 [Acidimicrobiaceae bacterium]|nr:hypothetical protein [Acidimicrobiaceae bacterium]